MHAVALSGMGREAGVGTLLDDFGFSDLSFKLLISVGTLAISFTYTLICCLLIWLSRSRVSPWIYTARTICSGVFLCAPPPPPPPPPASAQQHPTCCCARSSFQSLLVSMSWARPLS